MKKIPLLVPSLPSAEELLPYLREIDQHRWYTNFGPLNQRFERQLAASFPEQPGAAITTVSDCTAGLELALQGLGLASGAKVLLPGLTFVASATAITRAGLTPVIADVDADNWLLTPAIARQYLEHISIDAIMPVTTFGAEQDVMSWDELSEATGIPVLIDAAGAYGNQRLGRHVTLIFSLHATKAMGIGEGGFVIGCNSDTVQQARRLSNFGLNLETGLVETAGTNAKLSEYHAAVGLAAMDRWQHIQLQRQKLQQNYLAALTERDLPIRFQQKDYTNGIYPTFPILLPTGMDMKSTRAQLAVQGIETRQWYCPPIHRHPAFAQFPLPQHLPVCETISQRLLGLPFHLYLSEDDIEFVADTLAELLADVPADHNKSAILAA
ncbi:DegT/DnrJ/EryC1/StrS family aminotransferase [Chitinivorax sp. B]|uniref:DegT/DnrJ/EryC1/StrS family aminotransferase n=1 Tax=Chitinivorax sp. B TaxID=2502235 RepID=UPI0010F96772|nr:DegT/DnrJ/EryC1/StrS family aminotransferase [Chitinivorax sp. B]